MRYLHAFLGLPLCVQGNSQLKKVIELLEGMMEEGKKVMNEEQVLFAEQKQFCIAEVARLEKEIQEGKDQQANIEGDIADAQGEQASLTELIEKAQSDVQAATGRKDEAKKTRDEEHATFLKESMDLEESVSALTRASAIIQRTHSKNKSINQAGFFLQVKKDLPEKAVSLLSQDPAAFESKSGGVLELLNDMEEKFKKKLHDCKMSELHRKQNWELETQRLVDLIQKGNDAISERQTSLGERKADEGKSKQLLAATVSELGSDTKEHRGTTTSCSQKARSFADKQQLRKDELAAQEKAVEVLSTVPGHSALVQTSAFLQIRKDIGANNSQVGSWIRSQGTKLNSRALVQLADQITEDPFAKVKLMIKEMISKIQTDMQQAQETKNFCELGFSKNNKKRDKLNSAVKKLEALIEKSTADAAQLNEDVKDLNEKVQATRDAVAKATSERAEEKAINEKKIKDAQDAQTAVAHAIQVLQEFYAGAASATAFYQKGISVGSSEWNALSNQEAAVGYDERQYHAAGEETFGESYQGQQDKSGVIIGILEVVLSDYAREQSSTEASEAESVSTHEKFVQEAKVSVASMTSTSSLKAADAKEKEATLAQAQTDLKNTNKQVNAVAEERAALVPMCPPEHGGTKGVVSFEERTAQREEEIASLKQALEMLAPRDSA